MRDSLISYKDLKYLQHLVKQNGAHKYLIHQFHSPLTNMMNLLFPHEET